MEALLGIGTAFGLSTSAGLNAYIPLLIVAVMSRVGWLNLNEPYAVVGNTWVIATLVVLLLIETLVDKIPAVDSINDLIQTLVRPAAGALLFAANANVVTEMSPVVAVIIGLILAGSVHTAKGIVRPAVTATTLGTGNWVVSIIEDVIAFFVSLLSLIMPIIITILLITTFIWGYILYRRRRNAKKLAF